MGMLKRIALEKEPEQAVDAEHKFAKKPIHRPLSNEINALTSRNFYNILKSCIF